MSLGFALVAVACAFCAGLSVMMWSDGLAAGSINEAEDANAVAALTALFVVATGAMMVFGVWVSK